MRARGAERAGWCREPARGAAGRVVRDSAARERGASANVEGGRCEASPASVSARVPPVLFGSVG